MTSIGLVRSNRRDPSAVERFAAPPELVESLQAVLVDLIELHLQGKQAHWNVVGTNFRDLHLQLDGIVDTAREAADVIAERMRALRATPDGRSETVAATTTLPALPAGTLSTADVVTLMTEQLAAAVMTVRGVHDTVDAADPSSADLLHSIIDDLEKQAWMLSVETENDAGHGV
jgi:starvation-inducible DNA-binding protein